MEDEMKIVVLFIAVTFMIIGFILSAYFKQKEIMEEELDFLKSREKNEKT